MVRDHEVKVTPRTAPTRDCIGCGHPEAFHVKGPCSLCWCHRFGLATKVVRGDATPNKRG